MLRDDQTRNLAVASLLLPYFAKPICTRAILRVIDTSDGDK